MYLGPLDEEDLTLEYWLICVAWRGGSGGRNQRMTVNEAIRRLSTIASSAETSVLAQRARSLLDEIVFGRNYNQRKEGRR